jgi:hypothetical protein
MRITNGLNLQKYITNGQALKRARNARTARRVFGSTRSFFFFDELSNICIRLDTVESSHPNISKLYLCVCIWVYLYSPPVAHMGESSRRLIVILDFWRIVQDTDTERSPNSRSPSCLLIVPSVYAFIHGPRFKVSERLISNFGWQAREANPQCRDYKSGALIHLYLKTERVILKLTSWFPNAAFHCVLSCSYNENNLFCVNIVWNKAYLCTRTEQKSAMNRNIRILNPYK